MTKILFVCHGNICRSPMAEFVLKNMVRKAGCGEAFEIASAGVSREELGNPMYPPACRELQRQGVPYGAHRARMITKQDYDYFDRIYYMDSSNARSLARMLPPNPEKIRPFLPREVADPWYSGDFSQTWRDVVEGCEKILEEFGC